MEPGARLSAEEIQGKARSRSLSGTVFMHQRPREVKTKFSKSFTTFFFPVGQEIRQTVEDCVTYLRQEKLWGNDDPLFPATQTVVGATHQFEAVGLRREHWRSAAPIRAIFRDAFKVANLPYFNPHSLRSTLTRVGETVCQSPEEFKAWSQNLGHEEVLTTFRSYGAVGNQRQGALMHGSTGGEHPPASRPALSPLDDSRAFPGTSCGSRSGSQFWLPPSDLAAFGPGPSDR